MNFLGWVLLPVLTAFLVGTIVMLSADGPAGVVTFLWGAGIIAAGVVWFLIGCLMALTTRVTGEARTKLRGRVLKFNSAESKKDDSNDIRTY